METLNYYSNISAIRKNIVTYLANLNNTNSYKYLYVYGEHGIGKTTIIKTILNDLNYNINYIDCNCNKLTIEELYNLYINKDVYSLFLNNIKNNAIILDNIGYYLYNDKSYLTNLIKLLKKNIKIKHNKFMPFIVINNNQEDKKYGELAKLSYNLKIFPPSNLDLEIIINKHFPNILCLPNYSVIIKNILLYLNNKYYKLNNLNYYYTNNIIEIKFDNSYNYCYNTVKNSNANIKLLTKNFLEYNYCLKNLDIINFFDRTSLTLLLHENILKLFPNSLTLQELKIYKEMLQNYIFCDCIDKNIFLYQIWQLNDIVYIIKIYFNNFILHKHNLLKSINLNDIIFTKILTKYSSEYNNYNFIFNSTQKYGLNKKNLFLYIYSKNNQINEIDDANNTFNNEDDESKLLNNRIMKLISQYTNYSLSNSCKFLQTTDDVIGDEFFH
jgi:hypothetical protein